MELKLYYLMLVVVNQVFRYWAEQVHLRALMINREACSSVLEVHAKCTSCRSFFLCFLSFRDFWVIKPLVISEPIYEYPAPSSKCHIVRVPPGLPILKSDPLPRFTLLNCLLLFTKKYMKISLDRVGEGEGGSTKRYSIRGGSPQGQTVTLL